MHSKGRSCHGRHTQLPAIMTPCPAQLSEMLVPWVCAGSPPLRERQAQRINRPARAAALHSCRQPPAPLPRRAPAAERRPVRCACRLPQQLPFDALVPGLPPLCPAATLEQPPAAAGAGDGVYCCSRRGARFGREPAGVAPCSFRAQQAGGVASSSGPELVQRHRWQHQHCGTEEQEHTVRFCWQRRQAGEAGCVAV